MDCLHVIARSALALRGTATLLAMTYFRGDFMLKFFKRKEDVFQKLIEQQASITYEALRC
jgi:hypothetical protein